MITLINNNCYKAIQANHANANPTINRFIDLFMTNRIKSDNSIDQLWRMHFSDVEWEWLVRIRAVKSRDDGRIQLHPESVIESPYAVDVVMPWQSEEFEVAWLDWKRERARKHIKKYTPGGEQAQLHRLHNICRGDEALAIASIKESIAQGHQGVYLAKNYKSNSLQKFFNT
jgi:hypothetical protein